MGIRSREMKGVSDLTGMEGKSGGESKGRGFRVRKVKRGRTLEKWKGERG